MKPAFVADLSADQTITSFFLVCGKEIRSTREGKPFLRLELGDCTGTIEARMWDNFEQTAGTIERDDFVKVQGRVEVYRNKTQLMVDRLRRAEPGEVDPADYFPHTTQDVEQLYAQLREHVASIGNTWLRRLLSSVVEDPEIVPKLKRAPGFEQSHPGWIYGLQYTADGKRLVSAGLAPGNKGYLAVWEPDAGKLLHDILRRFFEQHRRQPLYQLDREALQTELRELADRVFDEHERVVPPLNKQIWKIDREIRKILLDQVLLYELELQEKASAHGVVPAYFEVAFGGMKSNARDPHSTDQPLELTRSTFVGEETIQISGQIDRVDTVVAELRDKEMLARKIDREMIDTARNIGERYGRFQHQRRFPRRERDRACKPCHHAGNNRRYAQANHLGLRLYMFHCNSSAEKG